MANDLKRQIAGSFSLYSKSYDQYAQLQKKSAVSLINNITDCQKNLPDGPILEVGCGSGMLSETLARFYADRQLSFLDISSGMLNECRNRLQKLGYNHANFHFVEKDAETISDQEKYALIVSGLTFQWFNNLQTGIEKLFDALLKWNRWALITKIS